MSGGDELLFAIERPRRERMTIVETTTNSWRVVSLLLPLKWNRVKNNVVIIEIPLFFRRVASKAMDASRVVAFAVRRIYSEVLKMRKGYHGK